MACSSVSETGQAEDVATTQSAVSTPSTPRTGWGFFTEDGDGWRCRSANVPSVVTGMSCGSPDCSLIGVHCMEVPGQVVDPQWGPWFSEEGSGGGLGACSLDRWITAVDCRGDNCDDMRVECSTIVGNTWRLDRVQSELATTFSQTLTAFQTDFPGYAQTLRCNPGFGNCGKMTAEGSRAATFDGTSGPIRTDAYAGSTTFNSDWNPDNIGDWNGGFVKATCPADMVMLGLSVNNPGGDGHAHGAFCAPNKNTSVSFLGYPVSAQHETVALPQAGGDNRLAQRKDQNGNVDWSDGEYKLECAGGEYVSGISKALDGKFHAIRCSKAINLSILKPCHDVPFDTGDGGFDPWSQRDWDAGKFKGRCGDDEYIAGVSVNTANLTPHSALCCAR